MSEHYQLDISAVVSAEAIFLSTKKSLKQNASSSIKAAVFREKFSDLLENAIVWMQSHDLINCF